VGDKECIQILVQRSLGKLLLEDQGDRGITQLPHWTETEMKWLRVVINRAFLYKTC
jgi:hypothetical protein